MIRHAIDRAWERYGVTMTLATLQKLERRIRAGDVRALRLGPVENGTLYAMRHARQWMAAIWVDDTIATFLPGSVLGPHRRELNRYKRVHGFKQSEAESGPANRNRSDHPRIA